MSQSQVSGHTCDGPVSLVIHDASNPNLPGEIRGEITERGPVGIPVAGEGLVLHERKDGPLAISRRVQVDFPLEGLGDNWFEYIDSYNERGGMQRATVQMNYQDTDITVFHGYVGGVGSNGTNIGHLTLFGPYNLLDSIPTGARFGPEAQSMSDIANVIIREFNERQEIFEPIDYVIEGIDIEDFETDWRRGLLSNKNFSENRDTLADVVEWFQETFGFRAWFSPSFGSTDLKIERHPHRVAGGQQLVIGRTEDPPFGTTLAEGDIGGAESASKSTRTVFDATDDGTLDIVSNNAIYEMKPFNTVKVHGVSTKEISTAAGTVHVPTENQPQATAYYEPLVDRAGGRLVKEVTVGESSLQALEEIAKTRLKDALDDTSGGSLMFPLSPVLHPYHRVIAKPACAGIIDADLPEITYEVQRTAHKIQPNDRENNDIPLTEVAVSIAIDSDNITVESGMATSTPSYINDDRISDDDRWSDYNFTTP